MYIYPVLPKDAGNQVFRVRPCFTSRACFIHTKCLRVACPSPSTLQSTAASIRVYLNYCTTAPKDEKNGTSKQKTQLLDSKCMFYSMAILWHCLAMVGLLCSRDSSSKKCTVHTSQIGKVKLAKPTAGQKINPCQVCEAKFSVSSGDPLSYLLPQELFPYLSRDFSTGRGHFGSNQEQKKIKSLAEKE